MIWYEKQQQYNHKSYDNYIFHVTKCLKGRISKHKF